MRGGTGWWRVPEAVVCGGGVRAAMGPGSRRQAGMRAKAMNATIGGVNLLVLDCASLTHVPLHPRLRFEVCNF